MSPGCSVVLVTEVVLGVVLSLPPGLRAATAVPTTRRAAARAAITYLVMASYLSSVVRAITLHVRGHAPGRRVRAERKASVRSW
jgi:hypothetical protein